MYRRETPFSVNFPLGRRMLNILARNPTNSCSVPISLYRSGIWTDNRVGIAVGQFSTRSIPAQNFFVMEFVHGYFWQFQNTEAQIDRSVGDYFRFCILTDTRFSLMISQWSVVGLAMRFFAGVELVTSSRSILLRRVHDLSKKPYKWWFTARLFAVLKSM